MQVNSIQSKDQPNFGAKLKIIGPKVPEPLNTELIEKAKKIGLENDIIEFSFGGITRKSEDYWSPQDNFYMEDWQVEVKNKLKTTFTQEGKIKESFTETVYQSDYGNILDDNEERMGEILDYLHRKYPNDIWA